MSPKRTIENNWVYKSLWQKEFSEALLIKLTNVLQHFIRLLHRHVQHTLMRARALAHTHTRARKRAHSNYADVVHSSSKSTMHHPLFYAHVVHSSSKCTQYHTSVYVHVLRSIYLYAKENISSKCTMYHASVSAHAVYSNSKLRRRRK